jgi:SSS family solute:Na+ symporter
VVAVGAAAYVGALDADSSLVQLLATAYGIISQLAPPIVAAMYWRRATTPGVLAGLLAGLTTAALFYLRPDLAPFDMHEGVLGLLVHVPVLVGVSLATSPQDSEHVESFCGSMD